VAFAALRIAAAASLVGLAVAVGAGAAPKATVVPTIEKEFKILPATAAAKAGKVTFSVRNTGKIAHEFIVLKTALAPAKLPVKGAKAVLVGKVLGQLKSVAPGKTSKLILTLPKGKYVLLCNLPAHYQAGQRAAFTVK
jgi:uncharacterized cupredoxin-like copper-binding protein